MGRLDDVSGEEEALGACFNPRRGLRKPRNINDQPVAENKAALSYFSLKLFF
jgi:hypothetical protein